MVLADAIDIARQTKNRRAALRQSKEAVSVVSLRQLNVNHTRNLNYQR